MVLLGWPAEDVPEAQGRVGAGGDRSGGVELGGVARSHTGSGDDEPPEDAPSDLASPHEADEHT